MAIEDDPLAVVDLPHETIGSQAAESRARCAPSAILNRPMVFIDLETGGLRPHHPTIQIGCLVVDELLNEVEGGVLDIKIKFDERACDASALKLNGYTPERWAFDVVPIGEALDMLTSYLLEHGLGTGPGARLAGHGILAFDVPRLLRDAAASGFCGPTLTELLRRASRDALDTRQASLWWRAAGGEAGRSASLVQMCHEHAIDTTGAHDAVRDCRLSAALMRALLWWRAGPAIG